MTAVTTKKRPQRLFSSGSNLRFGGRQSTVTMGFHALAQSRLSPRFSSTRKNKSMGCECNRRKIVIITRHV